MKAVRSGFWSGGSLALWGLSACIFSTSPALAGLPIPAPLAGAVGPLGLLAAGAGYCVYRLVMHFRNRG